MVGLHAAGEHQAQQAGAEGAGHGRGKGAAVAVIGVFMGHFLFLVADASRPLAISLVMLVMDIRRRPLRLNLYRT